MKKKPNKRKLIKKLDILFSKIVRSKGYCQICGKTDSLQCAHVLSRRHMQTRWDFDNALCLCWNCHFNFAHKDPIGFARWYDKEFGADAYDKLKAKANKILPVDYEKILQQLQKVLAQ